MKYFILAYLANWMLINRDFVSLRSAIRFAKNRGIYRYKIFKQKENGSKAFIEDDCIYSKGVVIV